MLDGLICKNRGSYCLTFKVTKMSINLLEAAKAFLSLPIPESAICKHVGTYKWSYHMIMYHNGKYLPCSKRCSQIIPMQDTVHLSHLQKVQTPVMTKKKKVYFLCYVRVRKRNATTALFVPLLEKCANFSKNGWEDFQWSLLSVYAII